MGRRAAAPEWDAARTGMEMLPQKWLFWSEISPFSNTELFPPQTIFSLKTTASCQVWGGGCPMSSHQNIVQGDKSNQRGLGQGILGL